MFRIISVLVLVSLFFACSSEPPKIEQRIEKYDTGVVSRTSTLVNGKKEGKMVDYYPNGNLMAERFFSQGLQNGRTAIYYNSGAIKEVQYYNAGQQQGGDTLWYEDGKIQFTVFFNQNKKDGYLRKWGPDGAMIYESKYSMDTLVEVKGQPLSRKTIIERSKSDTLIKPSNQ